MRLPGRGARPPPPAPRQDAPAAPPRWTSAPPGGLAPRGREHGRLKPGGARLFPPRVPWLQGPGPLGCARRPPRGPGSVPPGSLGKPAHASNASQAWAGLGGAPAPPGSTPARGPVPAQQRSAPPARGRERAPVQTVRRCARAKALARSHASPSLTARASPHLRNRRRLRWSPLATPARCPVLRPRPGHSGI